MTDGRRLLWPRVAGLCAPVAGLWLLLQVTAWGHRDHGVWTEMIWSGDRFEITHHIHREDAQAVLLGMDTLAVLDSTEGLARLALYVEERFVLRHQQAPVALEMVGAEVEGDFLYVYQEWLTADPGALPEFQSQMLADVVSDARTWIHVDAPGFNETLVVGNPDVMAPRLD